ncbi:hypothetical protein Thermus77412_25180 [Thermus antranikianii]
MIIIHTRDSNRGPLGLWKVEALASFAWNILGNHVVIRRAEGGYSLPACLRQRSVRVRPGEWVRRG